MLKILNSLRDRGGDRGRNRGWDRDPSRDRGRDRGSYRVNEGGYFRIEIMRWAIVH